jgi:hypothetical protein
MEIVGHFMQFSALRQGHRWVLTAIGPENDGEVVIKSLPDGKPDRRVTMEFLTLSDMTIWIDKNMTAA